MRRPGARARSSRRSATAIARRFRGPPVDRPGRASAMCSPRERAIPAPPGRRQLLIPFQSPRPIRAPALVSARRFLLRLRGRLFLRGHDLAEREDRGPVKINIRMLLFDGADRILVQRGTPQQDARRGAIPIQQPRLLARAVGVHQEGVFKSAAIAGQSEERHVINGVSCRPSQPLPAARAS